MIEHLRRDILRMAGVGWAALATGPELQSAESIPPAGAVIDESLIKRTLFVRPTGNDATGDGTDAKPFASMKKALATAGTIKNSGIGVKVLIAPGVYREGTAGSNWGVQFTSFQNPAPIVIEGEGWRSDNPRNTGDVIITGSEDWSGGWSRGSDGTWWKPWPYSWGVPKKNASITFGVSDAFLRQELVHVNGTTWYQVNPPDPNYVNQNGAVTGVVEGDNVNGGRLDDTEGSFWVVDAAPGSPGRITLKQPANVPSGFDLNAPGNLVEVSTKGGFQIWRDASSNSKTNIVVRNLTFQHFGRGYGALVQNQDNFIVEDCRFIKNKLCGFGITGARGAATLRRVDCSFNGECGAGLTRGSQVLFDSCTFNNNSRQGELLGYTGWSVCGIKLMFCSRVTMRNCIAAQNRSTGYWWDTGDVECEMIECASIGNSTNGAFIESNNSTDNNYSSSTENGKGVEGIPNLGARPTVTALRCIFFGNKPAAGTEPYRTSKGRGVFFSETENAVIDGCLIADNDIQIATYDNSRGENRNFIFRNNFIACLRPDQRLFGVGSTWDSGETIALRNNAQAVVGTIKGGWYGLFDGLNGECNDNTYYAPRAVAFPGRGQRWGTNKRNAPPAVVTAPTLTLEGWRDAHANNAKNSSPNRAVDSRSRIIIGPGYSGQPLTGILAFSSGSFRVTRVGLSLGAPLRIRYQTAGSARMGVDFASLDGSIVIPAGQRSAEIAVRTLPGATGRTLSIRLIEDGSAYFVAGTGKADLAITASADTKQQRP